MLIAIGTELGNQVTQDAVYKMVKNATVQMMTQPKALSKITGGFTKSDKIMYSIAKFVAATVKQNERKVEYVEKEDLKIEVSQPSPLSSNPSDSDWYKWTRKSGRDCQAAMHRKWEE